MEETFYCKVFYHYENIPKILQRIMREWFMKNRHGVVLIYNKHIDAVNKKFVLFKYKIDEYGDLVAYIPAIKRSKLWISLKEIES